MTSLQFSLKWSLKVSLAIVSIFAAFSAFAVKAEAASSVCDLNQSLCVGAQWFTADVLVTGKGRVTVTHTAVVSAIDSNGHALCVFDGGSQLEACHGSFLYQSSASRYETASVTNGAGARRRSGRGAWLNDPNDPFAHPLCRDGVLFSGQPCYGFNGLR